MCILSTRYWKKNKTVSLKFIKHLDTIKKTMHLFKYDLLFVQYSKYYQTLHTAVSSSPLWESICYNSNKINYKSHPCAVSTFLREGKFYAKIQKSNKQQTGFQAPIKTSMQLNWTSLVKYCQ